MDEASERELLKLLVRTEVVATVGTVLLVVLVALACYFLHRNHHRLQALEQQLEIRNAQGLQALGLLDEAVRKLEARN